MQQVGVWKERAADGVYNDGWNISVHWRWADERTENAAFYTDKDGWGSASVFLVRWNGIVKTENVI